MSQQVEGMAVGAFLWHDGHVRTGWDGLRKDVDLCDASADCLVYLYSEGCSRRPASIQVSRDALRSAECTELLACIRESPLQRSGMSAVGQGDLYLGPPKHLSREEMFRWHLTTRNFFAWVMRKPLAGPHLGIALSDLLDRMAIYRAPDADNVADLLAFADEMGYTYLTHQPDYATAILVFAEEQRFQDLWLDAFTHCVGMQDQIHEAPDFDVVGNVNKALISKAALQMDIDIEAKSRAIETFLEHDFDAHLGLTSSTQQHLDLFRSFLQTHFVASHGYWPPWQDQFSKESYDSVAEEFDCLFDLLADFAMVDRVGRRPSATGGICVLQNLADFDSRHGLKSVETALPLMPAQQVSINYRQSASKSFRSLLSSKDSKARILGHSKASHLAALNQQDARLQQSPLVQAFIRFEQETISASENQPSYDDGRKVRWMLVYGMTQLLHSILQASPDVTNRQYARYPLCCNTTSLPSWGASSCALPSRHILMDNALQEPQRSESPTISIHPDGETDYASYFSTTSPFQEVDQSNIHPALRRLMPIRTKSISQTSIKSGRISRMFSTRSLVAGLPTSHFTHESDIDDASDEESSPASTAPSLDWSRESRSSDTASYTSHDDLSRPTSRSSSVYSEKPSLPVKSFARGDIIDKGLAQTMNEDFICPGLF